MPALDDDEDLDDDSMYGGGLGSQHWMRGGGGGGGGGGMGSMLSAEAVWSTKVVHAQIALEPDDDCDDDSL